MIQDKIENKISLNIRVQKKCARSLFTVMMVKLINQSCPNSCQHCATITIHACKSGLQVVTSVITIIILLPSMTSFIEP